MQPLGCSAAARVLNQASEVRYAPFVPRVCVDSLETQAYQRLQWAARNGRLFDFLSEVERLMAGSKAALGAQARSAAAKPGTAAEAVMGTYARQDVVFARGEGSWLITGSGERYLDFGSGVAVNSLGHAHPALVAALTG